MHPKKSPNEVQGIKKNPQVYTDLLITNGSLLTYYQTNYLSIKSWIVNCPFLLQMKLLLKEKVILL